MKGEALVCFVRTMPGHEPSETLKGELKSLVGERLGSVLKPEKIHFVTALPKTRSGKIVRKNIRLQYLGEPVGDLSSVENPEALDAIKELAGK